MSLLSKLAAGAALAVVLGAGPQVLAADPHPYAGPPAGHPITMPSHGFRGAPPNFHGPLPQASKPGAFGLNAGPRLGRFHGQDFAHLSPHDRAAWEHGEWRHTRHHGHFGWWWYAAGVWFFYPAPIYPYPTYIGADSYYDYYDDYGTPPYYWYYCDNPPGYYPYVKECKDAWEPVPPTPQEQ